AIDILVNNAGAAESAPFHRMDTDMWHRMVAVNLTGTYLCSQSVIKGMLDRGYGRIVNIASTAGLTGYPYVTAYSAAKHGVIGLTRSLALELAKKGITVNAVCPGYTDTDMAADTVANIVEKTGRTEDEAIASLVKHNPQGRMIQPEEVAEAVLWLCQKSSGSINGQSIAVAGGEIL
ncbi:MAG: SDR family NAD(P)-dependent oxidoreductase, partial [Chloroflexota bacterium]